MPIAVTLAEAKKQLRVTHTDEDDAITQMIDAAEGWVRNYLNQPIPGASNSPPDPAPADIKRAILMVVAGFYENRESMGNEQVYHNPAVENLLHFHRIGIGI
jgi:hypothetical protein